MRHVRSWVLGALCALLAACSGWHVSCAGPPTAEGPSSAPLEASPVPSPTGDTRPKVVILGDSLTAGLGLVETESFPWRLQEKVDAAGFDFEVVNAGVSGDTSLGGLRRLDWALEEEVRVVVVALGANDGLRGLSVGEMKQNLAQIIQTARDKGAAVILAGMEAPPNYGPEYAASFRQVYRDLAQEYKTPFVPFLLDRVAGQPALNQADGIHPNARGAAIVADTVWSVLEPILNQLSCS